MNANTSRRLSTVLATAGLVWTIGISIWIWAVPIRSSGIRYTASSYTKAGVTVSSGIQSVPFQQTRRFADVSLLGATPLVVPVLLAAWGAFAAWRNRGWQLAVSTGLLAVFCFLGGFSIGSGYLPGAAGLVLAAVVRLDAAQTPP